MPLYDYECPKCKSRIEKLQNINDDTLIICSVCGTEMKRQIGVTSFRLKGGGWYKDGYQKRTTK